jgi:hypothetical protein
LIRCFATAIEIVRLAVCWNHIEGGVLVEVWYTYASSLLRYAASVRLWVP